jgi:E3 ubiquitin-protein ligase BOI and related proteins
MAVQAQFGGFAGCLPPYEGSFAEEQIWALKDYGAGALQFAAVDNGYHCPPGVVSGAKSELTCNGNGGGGSRKRGREDANHFFEQYVSSPSAAALLPIPAMLKSSRVMDLATASTSGRTYAGTSSALVRAECERLRAELKRQWQELARAVLSSAARRLREKETELDAARRRNAELEERLRQAAAESRAWRGLAGGHEAVSAELRAALDHHLMLLRGAAADVVEGFGESAAADDAQSSCCLVSKDGPANTAAASTYSTANWACRACGKGEASVLLLPCQHLCLCKACEPRLDACPVCLAAKNTSIHVAPN